MTTAADGRVDLGCEVAADVIFLWPEGHLGKCIAGATFMMWEGKLIGHGVFVDDLDATSLKTPVLSR
jgi:hypothetical protein